MHPKYPESVNGDGVPSQQPQQQQQQQHKKQVRRRVHTTRPYQERLLNMAEARREIVTALKYHRASMKQANEKQKQQQQQQQQNYLANFSRSALPDPPPLNFSWPVYSIPPPLEIDSLNLALPNQPLGLNLNFSDFHNLDRSLYHNTNNFFSVFLPSSPSSSSSSPPISFPNEEVPSVATLSRDLGPPPRVSESCGGGGDLHQVMDEGEMAELRSIGEQYQMEWNDRMNLVTSVRWFKFLRSMELEPEKVKPEEEEDDGYCPPFDEIMAFPPWLNANERQHFDDYHSHEYFQYPALPW